ncbi:MAG: flippase-like domain-containing protein [Bacteroidetes bacterium]|nr:flippase-like domain-containing protein [Bacteroidota bacterium]
MAKLKRNSIIQFIVLLLIGLVLVWLSFKSVADKKQEIFTAFQKANYSLVLLSIFISLFSHFLRAYRWNFLLEPLGYKTKLLNANCHVLIGYMANYGIPRMGEISRCTLASRYDKVPFEVALGTVITERIVDTTLLLVIFFMTLLFEFKKLVTLANDIIFNKISEKFFVIMHKPFQLVLLVFFGAIAIALFFFLKKKLSGKLKGKFGNLIQGLWKGLSSIKNMKRPIAFVFYSLLIWACYYLSLYFCVLAIPATSAIGMQGTLTLLLFGTIGVVFSPGGLGAYPAILSGILISNYNIDSVNAFALPWLSWTAQFLLIMCVGVISLVILPLYNKNKSNESLQTS